MAEVVNPRTQNSPLRRAQAAATRARIIEAAAAVFATSGFQRARIEDIANEAGVAYPTVYKAFGNKPALLTAAVTSAMSGGAETTSNARRGFRSSSTRPTPRPSCASSRATRAASTTEPAACSRPSASPPTVDENIAMLWQAINDDRVARSHTTAKRLATKTRLRASVPATARTLWALTLPEIYVLQVHHGQLTPDEYERWLADLLLGAIRA